MLIMTLNKFVTKEVAEQHHIKDPEKDTAVIISAWDSEGNPVQIIVTLCENLRGGHRGKARLGFVAPECIQIDRNTVFDTRNGSEAVEKLQKTLAEIRA